MSDSYTSLLARELAPGVLERFLRYVRIDTQSSRDRTMSPSTPGQLELARILVDDLVGRGRLGAGELRPPDADLGRLLINEYVRFPAAAPA